MTITPAIKAFMKSSPHVDILDEYPGPVEIPKAEKIQDIAHLLWSRKGKRLRPHLVFWFGEIVGVEPEKLKAYAWAGEALHTATLLHDDVIDRADVRRGGPSAAKVYDNTLSVIAGDYLLADVINQVALQGNHENLVSIAKTLKDLCSGECLQYETKFQIPETDQVFADIASLKTSSLFKWCALAGPNLAQSSLREVIGDFIESFGVLFQQTDDFLDVYGTSTKDRWNDLEEGKLNSVSWPLLQKSDELKRMVESKFAQETVDGELVALFTEVAERHKQENLDKIKALASETLGKLAGLPNSDIKEGLEDLVNICAERAL